MILKTPLRYPGGKSRAIKYLGPNFPNDFKEFREPFLGGGSVAIHVTKENPDTKIWVNDAYYNLYNFWVQLRDNGERLHQELVKIKEPIVYETKKTLRPTLKEKIKEQQEIINQLSHKEKKEMREKIKNSVFPQEVLDKIKTHKVLFDKARQDIDSVDDFTKAVYFYILNKCSFSGLGESSSFSEQASEQNFNLSLINKLPEYSKLIKNWHITNIDYEEVMNASGEDCFVFLDPPYDIKDDLYGKNGNMHSGFDHMKFYEDVVRCENNWMITYNSNEILRNRFSDYYFNDWDLTYTMRSNKVYTRAQKERKELLITNYKRKKYDYHQESAESRASMDSEV